MGLKYMHYLTSQEVSNSCIIENILDHKPNKPLISHGLEKDKKWIIIIPKRRKYGILKSQGIAPHFPF